MDRDEKEGIRLQVYLSQCGLGSRRKCEELISKGHVKINNRYITKMGERFSPMILYITEETGYPLQKRNST